MGDTISHEEHDNRGAFFIERDGKRIAEMLYTRSDATRVVVVHTGVDESLRGQGIARRLLDAAVAWARETGTKITPRCSYIVAEVARDPSLGDVVG